MGIMKKTSIVMAIFLLVGGLVLMGCGDSAVISEMRNFLQSLDKKVTELNESIEKIDTNKIEALEKEIATLKDSWTTKRNEHGDDLTPQEMEQMVEEFNRIVGRFNEIEKKKIG